MHFYSLSYGETMSLPIKTFWMLNSNIERIQAQKDMRALTVAVCGQGSEAAKSYRETLVVEIGTVVKLEESNPLKAVRDEAGFQALRDLANKM